MSIVVNDLQVSSVAERSLQAKWESQQEFWSPRIIPFDTTVREFALGLDGERPDNHVVDLADRLVQRARAQTEEPEITIDVDGALSFDLRLKSGLLMFAELAIGGTLDVTIINDGGPEARVVKHLPEATELALVGQF